MFFWAYIGIVGLTLLWSVLAVFAVARTRARAGRARLAVPLRREAVSVLKPLCGVDQALESNLRSFFEQRGVDFELVFGVQDEDPALQIVRKLREEYPRVRCRIVRHDGGRAINPKVSNLRAMLAGVRHDVVVISDSNIEVAPHYLREMLDTFALPRTGIVTNLFSGVGERTLGAALENLHLNGTVAAGVAIPTELAGHAVVVGKSMMFRRSLFERLGGFESVATVLAEDYVIGRMFQHAGLAIRIAPTPIRNVCATTTPKQFFMRHLRWGMIRVRLVPFAHLAEPLTSPIVISLLAPLAGLPLLPSLAIGVGVTMLRDGLQWIMLRGPRGLEHALPLALVRDLMMLAAWAAAPFIKHVVWRGNRVRVSAGTRLYAETPMHTPNRLLVESRVSRPTAVAS